jgi:hypothetical protein
MRMARESHATSGVLPRPVTVNADEVRSMSPTSICNPARQLANIGVSGRLNLQYFQYFQFEIGTFVLISLLPLLGSLHLVQLAKPSGPRAMAV